MSSALPASPGNSQGRRGLAPGTAEYGTAFESFTIPVFPEIKPSDSGTVQRGARSSATSMISRASR